MQEMLSETEADTPTQKIDKSVISKNVITGDYKLSPRPTTSSSSEVWDLFEEILNEKNIIISGFVACKKCKQVFKHDSKLTGTSSLKRHVNTCRQKMTSKKLSTYFQKSTSSSDSEYKDFKQEDKDLITNRCVRFISKDLRSFKTVAGPGFIQLAQTLINIGATRGAVDAKLLLPDPTTVSRKTAKVAENLRNQLIPELNENLGNVGGGITLDFWTDDYRKVGYLCITAHYINSNWNLKERVLCTTEWDSELKKTGENIKTMVINSLKVFHLDKFFNSLIYVTDRGTNIVSALKSVTRLSCSVHILNTVLLTTFSRVTDTNILEMIHAGKRLVMYFKQTGMQNKLDKTLKAPVETRWNSMYMMFESISIGYVQICSILEERSDSSLLNDLPLNGVNAVFLFLKRFCDASEELQTSKQPTLYLVMVWFKRLQEHLAVQEDEEEGIAALKCLCLDILEEKFTCHMLHKVAVFLHPSLKSLKKFLPVAEIAAVHTRVRELVAELIHVEADISLTPSTSQTQVTRFTTRESTPKQPRKKFKVSSLSDMVDDEEAEDDKDDVQKYIEFKISKSDKDIDILDWWKINENLFPFLSKVARFILAIPASSAPSERDFSTAGFIIQERRTQLHPSTVDDILFLHSNLI